MSKKVKERAATTKFGTLWTAMITHLLTAIAELEELKDHMEKDGEHVKEHLLDVNLAQVLAISTFYCGPVNFILEDIALYVQNNGAENLLPVKQEKKKEEKNATDN